jgi:hypothetical protein
VLTPEPLTRALRANRVDADVDVLRAAAGCLARWQRSRLEPSTVVHGDYRLGPLGAR